MGLFTRKKSENAAKNLPEFPVFPQDSAPRKETVAPLPAYESPLRQPVQNPIEPQQRVQLPLDIPQRQNTFLRQEPMQRDQEAVPQRASAATYFNDSPSQDIWKPPRTMQQPAPTQQAFKERLPEPEAANVAEDKPVFVKIQQYREAMASIELLKQKAQDVEFVLGKIEELRAQEQVELNNCQNDLNKIKEKLIGIDKKLFEV